MRSWTGRLRRRLNLLAGTHWNLVLAVVAPFLFAFLVGSIYSGKKLTELPVTIVDQDDSKLSREITSALLSAEPFVLGQYAESVQDFRGFAEEGTSSICIVFPAGFERNVKSGKDTEVAILVNAENLIAANVGGATAASVIGAYSIAVDMMKMQIRGVPAGRARSASLPVSMQSRNLFNPALNANYANFLVLGMLGIAIQLSALLATARMNEYRKPRPILHLTLMSLVLGSVSWAAVRLTMARFDLPNRGREWLLATVILWFVSNLVVLGFAISNLVKDAVFASEVCALITMPNFLASGYTWPVFAMPGPLKILAYALPMNPLIFAMRKISLMGAGATDLGFELALLGSWSAAASALAFVSVRHSKVKAQVAFS